MVDRRRSISNKICWTTITTRENFCPTLKTFPRFSAHDKLSKRPQEGI